MGDDICEKNNMHQKYYGDDYCKGEKCEMNECCFLRGRCRDFFKENGQNYCSNKNKDKLDDDIICRDQDCEEEECCEVKDPEMKKLDGKWMMMITRTMKMSTLKVIVIAVKK